jgi:hypothetical protein
MNGFLVLLLLSTLLVHPETQEQGFLVLGEFFYKGQPADSSFERMGIHMTHVVYQDQLGSPSNESMVRAQARASVGRGYNNMVQMDQEYWDTGATRVGITAAHANARKLCETFRWFKSEEPTLSVGFYSLVPTTDLYAYLRPTTFAAWQRGNDALQILADSVDYLCPGIYAYYADTAQYAGYARAIIAEAKRLARGKPVYPFVSPYFHPSGNHPKQEVTQDYFARILKTTIEAGANGVIIFAGTTPDYGDSLWDDNAGWWTATKEFLASLGPQNHPDPFSTSTIIRFELPHPVHVSLEVFNTRGQLVTTLVNEMRPAGVCTVQFDGSTLTSGVYFYHLRAGSYVATKKMLLVK